MTEKTSATANDAAQELSEVLRSSAFISRVVDPPLPLPVAQAARRCLPRYWLTRLYLSFAMLGNAVVVALLPNSPTAAILGDSITGWAILATLAIFCSAGVADVAVNDLMPCRYQLPFFKDHRHWIYNGIALSILALTYFIVLRVGWTPLLVAYLDDLVIALAVAPLDLFARHRENR